MFLDLEQFEWVEEASYSESETNYWVKIEDGDWISSGKWEYQKCVVQNSKTKKYYQYELSRSGSYYSEYYYPYIEDDKGVHLTEVIPVEKTVVITTWERK